MCHLNVLWGLPSPPDPSCPENVTVRAVDGIVPGLDNGDSGDPSIMGTVPSSRGEARAEPPCRVTLRVAYSEGGRSRQGRSAVEAVGGGSQMFFFPFSFLFSANGAPGLMPVPPVGPAPGHPGGYTCHLLWLYKPAFEPVGPGWSPGPR